jgi:glycosyl hydrolase family 12
VGVWDTSWKTWLYETRNPFSVTRTGYTMNCQDEAWLTAGSYAVQNNQWGRGPITDYSQCVGMGGVADDGSVSARWTWRWPKDPGEVKGYPAIVFGQKPGYPVTPNTNLPRQINAISQLTSAWSTRSTYTGRGQLTFDLWLTRDATRYPSFPQTPITHEVMVAVEPYGNYGLDRNPAWFVEEITINGVRYKTYKADNFPPGGSQQWRFLVFQMLTPMTQGTLEFKPLFDYLKSRGFITGSEYLSSLEFGTEPGAEPPPFPYSVQQV